MLGTTPAVVGADSYVVSGLGSWEVVVLPVAHGISFGWTGGKGMALVDERALAVIGMDCRIGDRIGFPYWSTTKELGKRPIDESSKSLVST